MTFSALASLRVCSRSSAWIAGERLFGGSEQPESPGVHARLLDVLHDAADQHVLAVADGIDVHLDRHVEEAIEQHRAVVRDAHRGASCSCAGPLR